MSTTASAYACAAFSSPGRPRKRKIATGSVGLSGRARNTVAPNSPSEMANAKPAATASARADDREVDLAAHAPGRRAEQRGGLALARVDRAQRRRHDPHDERDRDERLRDGNDPREPPGSRAERRSKAIRNPKPSITADAPSGSMSEPVEQRASPRESATANAASPPTTTRDHGRRCRVDDRVHDRLPRCDEERRTSGRRARGTRRGRSPSPTASERSTSTASGSPRNSASTPRLPTTTILSRAVLGCRSASRSDAEAAARRARRSSRQRDPHRDDDATSWTSERTAAARRSKRRTAWL